MPGNQEAWFLWMNAKTQWRAGGLGVVGLDLPAVRMVAGMLGIRWSLGLMRKVQALERHELERMAPDAPGAAGNSGGD